MKPFIPLRWILLSTLFFACLVQGEETPELPGLVVAREEGGFLSLNVENHAFVLRFYDESKIQIEPDAPRGVAFWRFRGERNRQPLTRQGNALQSPQRVSPPLAFSVNISLLSMTDKDVTESHNFDLRALAKEADHNPN